MIGFGIFPDFFHSDIRIWICRYYPEKMKKRTLRKTVSTRNISGMFMVLCTMYQYYVAKIRTREQATKLRTNFRRYLWFSFFTLDWFFSYR